MRSGLCKCSPRRDGGLLRLKNDLAPVALRCQLFESSSNIVTHRRSGGDDDSQKRAVVAKLDDVAYTRKRPQSVKEVTLPSAVPGKPHEVYVKVEAVFLYEQPLADRRILA